MKIKPYFLRKIKVKKNKMSSAAIFVWRFNCHKKVHLDNNQNYHLNCGQNIGFLCLHKQAPFLNIPNTAYFGDVNFVL